MNPEEINKLIPIEGVDTRELYGAQDVYVEQIRSLAPKVKIVARGSSLRVLGAKADVEAFERKMNSLIDYYIKYRHISKEVVAQAFAAAGISADDAPADQDVIVYGNNGPHVMEKPRKSDVIHYVKLTFARKVGGPNYSFYRKWGDVYENLRKDAAYLSVRSWNRGQDARPRWGRGILFFLLFALPIVVLYFLYGSKGMFDIAATMALGAYGLALVSFIGLVLLLVEIAIRAVALASSRRAAKDRKTIVEAIKTLIYQLRTTNGRPTIPFAKIARIERHYHAVEQD